MTASGMRVLASVAAPLPRSPLSFRVWQVKDGLPQNQVRDVKQTRDGYLWIATNDTLARFDGVRFAVFNRENTPSLRSNVFTALFEDRAGRLWIGSDGGLVRHTDGQFTTFTTAQGLAADTVTSIAESPGGQLLVATGNALNEMQGERFSPVKGFELPANRTIRQLCSTRSGDLWLATNAGAIRLSRGQAQHYTLKDGLKSENLSAVFEDRRGDVWFGTVGQGLIRWSQNQFEHHALTAGQPGNIVYALVEDAAGVLWIGTHGGLYQFSGGQFTHFTRRDGLPSDFVLALCTDHEGSLWAGTDGGGLARAGHRR